MLRCPELRKLPKSPKYTSILWRHQSPGSVTAAIQGMIGPNILDPGHPAARWRTLRAFPEYRTDVLALRAVPMSILSKQERPTAYPFWRHFVCWKDRVARAMAAGVVCRVVDGKQTLIWGHNGEPVGDTQLYFEEDSELLRRTRSQARPVPSDHPLYSLKLRQTQRRVPMSCFIATSKQKMGTLRFRRRKIGLRVKSALNLIVGRGAHYGDAFKNHLGPGRPTASPNDQEQPVMQFDSAEAVTMGRKWILQGWSYIFFLSIEGYRMPYSQLIPLLRQALSSVYRRGVDLEKKWLIDSIQRQPPGGTSSHTYDDQSRQGGQTDESQPAATGDMKAETPSNTVSSRTTVDHNDAWRRNLAAQLQLLSQHSKEKDEAPR